MNLSINRAAFAKPILAAALAVIGSYPVSSFANGDSYSVYRCWQGDTAQCRSEAPLPDVRVEKRVVLGPYALYLMRLGESREVAATKAQAAGEQLVERTVRITKQELSQAQGYQRVIAGLPTRGYVEQTLSEVAIDARDPRVASLHE